MSEQGDSVNIHMEIAILRNPLRQHIKVVILYMMGLSLSIIVLGHKFSEYWFCGK